MQTAGRHGANEGGGYIKTLFQHHVVNVEYRYHRDEDGMFHGSVSTWKHDADGAGLVAIMSRALPTRAAMLEWIFAKAEKLTQED